MKAASSVCRSLKKQHVKYYDTLQKKWVARDYYIYLPKKYCEESQHILRPVIYSLHGFQGTAINFARYTAAGTLNQLAEDKNLIVVYPQGMVLEKEKGKKAFQKGFYSSWNFLPKRYYNAAKQSDYSVHHGKTYAVCNINKMNGQNPIPQQSGCRNWQGVCSWTSCYDDASYLLAVQNQLEKQFNGDSKKQYLIGISNGAMMVYRMACQYPEKFRASVAIAGTTARGMHCYDTSKPGVHNPYLKKAQTSLLVLVGSQDQVVPLTKAQEDNAPDNTYYYDHVDQLVDMWGQDMRCQKHQDINNPDILDGIRCLQYSGCGEQNNTVAYCIWGHAPKQQALNWGHVYPGRLLSGGDSSGSIEAGTAFIYRFLKDGVIGQ